MTQVFLSISLSKGFNFLHNDQSFCIDITCIESLNYKIDKARKVEITEKASFHISNFSN